MIAALTTDWSMIPEILTSTALVILVCEFFEGKLRRPLARSAWLYAVVMAFAYIGFVSVVWGVYFCLRLLFR
ncbi:hypothetical protein Ga0100231_024130 [Opitutaceae bacterium TAV4]|nr:hypothetical protein Ga0100231_024130 [Opitutaceae bacterium TAV4]RRK00800.1 hypothetical protein Ga0100230_023705 [Opitutaceae bacterium TAV3]